MRICLFSDLLAFGGVERLFLLFSREFARRGHQVELVLARGLDELTAQMPAGVPLVSLDAQQRMAAIPRLMVDDPDRVPELPELSAYLHRTRPDVVLAAKTVSNLQAIWAVRQTGLAIRVFAGAHAFPTGHLSVGAADQARRQQGMTAVVRKWFAQADGIVAVSQAIARYVCDSSGVAQEQVPVIYNPAITPEIAIAAREPVGHPWFADGQPPVVLGVGRLSKEKAFATLIRAFARLRQRMVCRLMILGDGDERAELQALAGQAGVAADVSLPGYEANPYRFMSRAGAVAISSLGEGFSMVAAEALHLGTPVVATDCGGPREVLGDGRFGALVPVGDDAALSQAPGRAIGSTHPTGLEQHLRQFHVDIVIEQYLRLFEERLRCVA